MKDIQSLSHSAWECKYHVVRIPKYRKTAIYKELRKYWGEIFRDLARQKGCEILEGHLMADHVHILLSIPLPNAVSQIVGFIKWKSAIKNKQANNTKFFLVTVLLFLTKRLLFNSFHNLQVPNGILNIFLK